MIEMQAHLDTIVKFLWPLKGTELDFHRRGTMFRMILLVLVKRHPCVDGIFKLLLYRWC